jgi:hypothetical protein
MMMPKKDMDEDQLMWWNDTKADIMERKRQLRGESSTLHGESPMSGCGDGGVDNSTDAKCSHVFLVMEVVPRF